MNVRLGIREHREAGGSRAHGHGGGGAAGPLGPRGHGRNLLF